MIGSTLSGRVARAAVLLLVTGGLTATVSAPALAATGNGTLGGGSPSGTRGAGATLPFVDQQAEDARTNGTVLGPDWAYGTAAAESVGRRAVQLSGAGRYVEFRLTRAANAMDVRYSIPDSKDGSGQDATLDVGANGAPLKPLALTSRYSWYYGVYPWSNDPADGGPRQRFDDSRMLFGRTLPAGTRIRLQVPAAGGVATVVDSADFELVAAPRQQPAGSVSITDHGADPTGAKDSSDAIQAAIDAARGGTVWIPKGTFTVTRHLIVDDVTLEGAGVWYSVLHGDGVGVYGKAAPTPSEHVHLAHFAVFGEVQNRDDNAQVNGIGGALSHSTVDDVWVQHTKVGAWLDGPFTDLKISRLRVLDQTADGVNFHDGVTDSSVTNSFLRGTGDDGLAMWSDKDADAHNTFAHNTVQAPTLANTIAIYGGHDNRVLNNAVSDTLTQGAGIQVANRFGSVPLSGTTTVAGNVLVRTGSLDLFTHIGNGALWFWAGDEPMTGRVDVTGNRVLDSAYEAVQFYGDKAGNAITGVHLDRNRIDGTGTFAFQLNTSGSATVTRTVATHIGASGVYDCSSGFTLVRGRGDAGWSSSTCGYPAPGPLRLSATNLTFRTTALDVPAGAQTVTVTNPSNRRVPIASITATGTYAISTTCGSSLAAHASCTVTVRFAPTAHGDRGGALTISDGTSAGRYQVYLKGSIGAAGNLAADAPVTASSQLDGYPASNLTDGTTDTYWEAPGGSYPDTATVDLGSAVKVGRVVLKLNPAWGPREERIEVQTSTDGTTFTTAVPAAVHTFDPATANTVTIPVPTTTARYVRAVVASNTGGAGAQFAEFEVYAS